MMISTLEDLNVSLLKCGIPENHWTLLFIGEQGVGKSQLASLTVKKLSLLESLPVIVVCDANKEEDTIKKWWSKNVPEHVWWRGLTFAQLKKLSSCILVVEDAPLILRSKPRAVAVKSLLTALSRAKHIFTVVTSQYTLSRELKSTIPLRVEMQVVHHGEGKKHLFRVCEWRNASSWYDWTGHSDASDESAEPIVQAIYHGVGGENLGKAGRKVKSESKRQKAFAMFDRGCSNREVEEALGLSEESVCVYRHQWKKRRRDASVTNYINILRLGGGGGGDGVCKGDSG
jgi:DNA-binding NarL/FixJ family response regulator